MTESARRVSRRQFGRLTLGAAAAAGVGGLVGAGDPLGAGEASAALVPRAHGPVLTAGYDVWHQAVRNAAANLNKVITGWGAPNGSWAASPDHAWTAMGMCDFSIVRTHTGDTWHHIDPNTAVNEIRNSRLFEFKAIQKGAHKCIIELGNEPNIGVNDVNGYAYRMSQTIDAVRANFPGAKVCSTALSPNNYGGAGDWRFPRNWLYNTNWRNAVAKCDFVGVHFYSNDGNFANQGAYNEMTYTEMLDISAQLWPGKPVIATEYSIRNGLGVWEKGRRYADLIHFNGSVRSNLWGATYFHVMVDPSGPNPEENVGSEGASGYRWRLDQG